MKTFKQYLTEEMDKKDQKYFLDQAKKLKDNFNKWYNQAENFCRELYDEGTLDEKASALMDAIDYIEDNVKKKIDEIVLNIKRS